MLLLPSSLSSLLDTTTAMACGLGRRPPKAKVLKGGPQRRKDQEDGAPISAAPRLGSSEESIEQDEEDDGQLVLEDDGEEEEMESEVKLRMGTGAFMVWLGREASVDVGFPKGDAIRKRCSSR